MPFDTATFCRLRPWLYHLTSRRNLDRIRASSTLYPASYWIRRSGRLELLRSRRPEHEIVTVDGEQIHLRDQLPLHKANCELDTDWSFEDLVQSLNERVYFWPGNEGGPINAGRNHFGRYRDEDCVVLVLPTGDAFEAQKGVAPQFSPFNSGSPRFNAGRASPRGRNTFLPSEQFPRTPGAVIEVTFRGAMHLPERYRVVDFDWRRWASVKAARDTVSS